VRRRPRALPLMSARSVSPGSSLRPWDRNVIPWFEENGRELFQAARQYDLEGIVAKWKADPYAVIRGGSRSRIQPIVRWLGGESCSRDTVDRPPLSLTQPRVAVFVKYLEAGKSGRRKQRTPKKTRGFIGHRAVTPGYWIQHQGPSPTKAGASA
jgi:hypothetical protein